MFVHQDKHRSLQQQKLATGGGKKFTPLCVTRNTEGTKKATAGLKMLESTKKAVEDEALGEKK